MIRASAELTPAVLADDYSAWAALAGLRPWRLGSAVYWLTAAAAAELAATLDGRELAPIGPGAPSEASRQ
jgi:hypothetical protein